MESKFKIGDRCKIVKYGHLVWVSRKEYDLNKSYSSLNLPIVMQDKDYLWIDLRPEYVGKEVVITGIGSNKQSYSTDLFSWAGNNQLQLIENNT